MKFPTKLLQCDLERFGFLVPRGQGVTLLGSLFTSTIFPGRAPADHVLLRNMIGGMLHPEVQHMDKDEMVRQVREDLHQTLKIDPQLTPSFQKVFRHEKAIPQYHVGHEQIKQRIRQAESRTSGFFASGNAIKGIGIIDCVREALPTAQNVNAFLEKQPPRPD